jgi:hypothetical protein
VRDRPVLHRGRAVQPQGAGHRVDHKALKKNPVYLIHDFNHCLRLLWRDKLGQISLATTTLFWGAGATLQFIVIKWAEQALHLDLSRPRCCRAWWPSAWPSAR